MSAPFKPSDSLFWRPVSPYMYSAMLEWLEKRGIVPRGIENIAMVLPGEVLKELCFDKLNQLESGYADSIE